MAFAWLPPTNNGVYYILYIIGVRKGVFWVMRVELLVVRGRGGGDGAMWEWGGAMGVGDGAMWEWGWRVWNGGLCVYSFVRGRGGGGSINYSNIYLLHRIHITNTKEN